MALRNSSGSGRGMRWRGRSGCYSREPDGDAVGIDLNATAIKAGKHLGLNLYSADISEVEPRSFDVVTTLHVLEHVSSPRTFLNQCAARLTSDGILAIEVPNYGCRNSRDLRERWPYLYPHLHLHQFTVATLRKYLITLGPCRDPHAKSGRIRPGGGRDSPSVDTIRRSKAV